MVEIVFVLGKIHIPFAPSWTKVMIRILNRWESKQVHAFWLALEEMLAAAFGSDSAASTTQLAVVVAGSLGTLRNYKK